MMCRRGLIRSAAMLPVATPGLSSKPDVKLSEVRPVISQFVKEVSDLSGRNLSPADKSKLESDILTKIQDQRIYNFVDP
jgi:hypothetical protein